MAVASQWNGEKVLQGKVKIMSIAPQWNDEKVLLMKNHNLRRLAQWNGEHKIHWYESSHIQEYTS